MSLMSVPPIIVACHSCPPVLPSWSTPLIRSCLMQELGRPTRKDWCKMVQICIDQNVKPTDFDRFGIISLSGCPSLADSQLLLSSWLSWGPEANQQSARLFHLRERACNWHLSNMAETWNCTWDASAIKSIHFGGQFDHSMAFFSAFRLAAPPALSEPTVRKQRPSLAAIV